MAEIPAWQERLKAESLKAWEKLRETPAVSKIVDRYHNLTPGAQRGLQIGSALLFALGLVSIPLSSFLSSYDNMQQFETRRDLINQLIATADVNTSLNGINQPAPLNTLMERTRTELKSALILPEQIGSIQGDNISSVAGKTPLSEVLEGVFSVSLNQLNLKQVVDLGYRLQNMDSALKVLDVDIKMNGVDARYLDVVYKIGALKVPPPPPPPEIEPPVKKGSSKNSKTKSDDL